MAITNSLTKVSIVVKDIATIIATYDRIRLYKSTTGVSGSYSEITASSAQGATLTGNKKEPFVLNGKDFEIEIDGTDESFTFGAVITAADAAAAITANTSATAVDSGGFVQITSPTTGTVSTLQFTSASEGAVALGLYQGDNDYGEEAWPTLVGGTKLYTVDDYQGSADYWYKYRFYATGTGTYSDYSAAFQGQEEGALDPAYIIYGTGYVVDMDGTPLENKKIYVYNRFIPNIVDSKLVAGERAEYTTESDGWVLIPFVKGSKVTIAIEDTSFTRDIDVPDTGDTFDLMTTDIQDSIGIVSYELTDATRTTI